jgi:hypothetical protein
MQSLQYKSLMENLVTHHCNDVTAKMQNTRDKNISSPESAQSGQPEARLGYMPFNQMLATILEVFQNACLIDEPEPKPKPGSGTGAAVVTYKNTESQSRNYQWRV